MASKARQLALLRATLAERDADLRAATQLTAQLEEELRVGHETAATRCINKL